MTSVSTNLPKSSKVVIVGGGIVGCSTAYHLAALGCETVLIEQGELTSGSTWHAAGLIGQLRSNANITQLLGDSVALYRKLEAETGQGTGWKMNGGLRLACNNDRWTEVKRQAATAQSFGLDMQLLSPSEAQALWPLMQIDDVIGAAFLPTDGQANPADIARALAVGARKSGALLLEGITATGIKIENGVICGLETSDGYIACEKIVCCAGQWSRQFAALAGVNVPLVSVQHQYIVTEKIQGVESNLPTLRDPDRLTYYKEEVGGLVMGGYESNPIPWAVNGIPDNFSFTLLDNNLQHFEPMLELAMGRVPALEQTGIKQMINGPESFTPDGNFILGEAPELANFFVGAGFNAFGIASGGGAGMALAEWVATGQPPYDLWPVDIRRFGAPHADTSWVRERTLEAYSRHYSIAWPQEENQSVRETRVSPLYSLLQSQGACFGEKLGWERPNWFAHIDKGEKAQDVPSFEQPNWHTAVAREHLAARNAAVLIDQTSFAKFLLTGVDATKALSWIAANDIDCAVGEVVYTQLLNIKGGIEADVTVCRLDSDTYYIVTGTGFVTHDFNWIQRNIPSDLVCDLIDVTSSYSVLSLMGPKAAAILTSVSNLTDVVGSNYKDEIVKPTVRILTIAGASIRAIRVSYLGGPGWELHIPVESALAVYKKLMSVGKDFDLINAGYRCIESCRLEMFYRAWGSDIGPDYTPLEAGLGWAVKLHKSNQPFLGRDALLRQFDTGVGSLKRRLVCFTTSDKTVRLLGRETIYRNDQRVGWLSSGGYGHYLDTPIGIGYVRNSDGVSEEYLGDGIYQLDVAGKRYDCQLSLKPLLKLPVG